MNIAILGFGTVGSGVFEIISNTKTPFIIKKVFDLRCELKEKLNDLYTDNIENIINDDSIEAVVECLGGEEYPYQITKRLLELKKHVITSNKEVVANHLKELLDISKRNNVYYLFEASCGGGIPNLFELSRLSRYDEIISIRGILNGTTNYILSKMALDGSSFNDCLKQAQELGFAEKDPTNDIMGYDIKRKSIILYNLAFNNEVSKSFIKVEPLDDKHLNKLLKENKTIKYIASITKDSINIEPKVVEDTDIFKNLHGAFNAIEIITKYNDKLVFIGKGAGKLPTASSIIKDLYEINENNNYVSHINLQVKYGN